ncbi:hypothetical protein KIH86_23890 [Paenibacillus sp. HN-1]|uniref:hypothetical protein n=1 Tax=Paenibacillus TaxID=44249 RepID=UPI001CA97FEC|nr:MULTISPECIES: hypothetical protein [Paenibacillus]MBY9081193.1 hypothetical protein [Paenibacillus sp. CGMCC 1.18879]MBY9087230.1 hypothetical protein [Paenibacillus sinensis]
MKKIGTLLLGIVIGAVLTFSPQIYGAGAKLLGSKVDNTLDIKLNGKSIGQGAVINGTSYLPVRSTAKALGLEVKVDSTTVDLTGKSSEELSAIAKAEQKEMTDKENKENKITDLTARIEKSKKDISGYESAIDASQSNVTSRKAQLDAANSNPNLAQVYKDRAQSNYDEAVISLELAKASLEAEKKNLADLEAQLAALQAQ